MTILYVDISNGYKYIKEQPEIAQCLSVYFITNEKFKDSVLYFYRPVAPQVIVGANQNVHFEVDLDYIHSHGIALTRRGAGGGAVYVDSGNLTYSFTVNDDGTNYMNFKHFAQPVIEVLHSIGVDAEMTGRNDLTVNGQKFSGMSTLKIGDRFTCGGTLMLDVDLKAANEALNPPKSKLKSKGIKSVKSRVTNLRPYLKGAYTALTSDQLQEMILKHVFNSSSLDDIPTYVMTNEDWDNVKQIANSKFGDPDWVMGKTKTFANYHTRHFEGIGTVGINYSVEDGIITHAKVYGDFNNAGGNLEQIEHSLVGAPYKRDNLIEAFKTGDVQTNIGNVSPEDLADMLLDDQYKEELSK